MQQLKTIVKAGLGVLFAALVASGDALTSIAMRLTKQGGLQDFQSIFWNQVAQMFFVLCLVIAVRPKLRGDDWRQTTALVGGGILRISATVFLCLSYLHALPGDTWSVVYGLSPVLTICLSSVLASERPNAVQVVGLVICGSGVAMIGWSMHSKTVNNRTLQEQVLTLLYPISASVLFTVCWVLLRWLSNKGVPLVTHMFYYSISGILLLPLTYILEKPKWRFPVGTWGLLVAQTLAYATQYLSNAAAIHNETIITVQILKVLTVPLAFILGYAVLGLVPDVLEMCGGAVVTTGAMLVGIWSWRLNLMKKRREQLMASLGFSDNMDTSVEGSQIPPSHEKEHGTQAD